jgi:hypothetical protein
MRFEFVWQVDSAGYQLMHEELREMSRDGRPRRAPVRTHYHPGHRPLDQSATLLICRKGGEFREIKPLETAALYKRIARARPSPDDALAFVNQFGIPSKLNSDEYAFDDFYRLSYSLNRAITAIETEDWRLIQGYDFADDLLGGAGRSQLQFVRGKDGAPIPIQYPESLAAAIWIQLSQDLVDGNQHIECERCGQWFRVGTGTGRRRTAKFCNTRCRQNAFYDRKKPTA